jgi:hypothetical protein
MPHDKKGRLIEVGDTVAFKEAELIHKADGSEPKRAVGFDTAVPVLLLLVGLLASTACAASGTFNLAVFKDPPNASLTQPPKAASPAPTTSPSPSATPSPEVK